MKTIKCWIEAMRLRTLPVSVAGVLAAWGFNLYDDNIRWTPAVVCLLFAVLAQIASNFANEYFDFKAGRDRQGREGPRRGVTEGDITPAAMRNATYLMLGLAGCLGLSLVGWAGWWIVLVGAAVAVGVFAYSTGPYPLSTNGLGEVAVVVFFGIVPVNMTYYVQTLLWSWPVFLGSLSIGLMSANVLIVNNYRDVEDDRAVNKRTLAVRWGRGMMRWLYAFNSIAAVCLMLPVWIGFSPLWIIAPLAYASVSGGIVSQMSKREGAALTPLLGMTAVSILAYVLVFVIAAATH